MMVVSELTKKAKTIRKVIATCCENWNQSLPCMAECDKPFVWLEDVESLQNTLRKDLEKRLLNYIHSCGYYLGDSARDRKNIKNILDEVLGLGKPKPEAKKK